MQLVSTTASETLDDEVSLVALRFNAMALRS